jgi:hypothetical protein
VNVAGKAGTQGVETLEGNKGCGGSQTGVGDGWWLRSETIHHSGVILKGFSPEGSSANYHNCLKGHIRCALDPSQAQDDSIMLRDQFGPF